jgi:hypothetical protein
MSKPENWFNFIFNFYLHPHLLFRPKMLFYFYQKNKGVTEKFGRLAMYSIAIAAFYAVGFDKIKSVTIFVFIAVFVIFIFYQEISERKKAARK